MLSKEQLDNLEWIMSKMGITWIGEIKRTEVGFNGYLLRCKSEPEEDCTKSIILFEPDENKDGVRVHKHLPADRDERINIRKSWYNKCVNQKCVCVSFDVDTEMTHEDWKKLENVFPTDGEMLEEIIDAIIGFTDEHLPSYKPFIMVMHNEQLNRYDGRLCVRPPHIHFMLRQVTQRITSKEIEIIEPSRY